MDKYLKAIKQNVCVVCVDSNERGGCTLTNKETCAVELYLPQIVEIVHSSEGKYYNEMHRQLKETICAKCRNDENGNCELHDDANCSLDRYFTSIVDIIQQVDAGKI